MEPCRSPGRGRWWPMPRGCTLARMRVDRLSVSQASWKMQPSELDVPQCRVDFDRSRRSERERGHLQELNGQENVERVICK